MARAARLLLALSSLSLCPPAPGTDATALGFSPERLRRLEAVFAQAVDEGRIAGAVTLVARHGKVAHLCAYGMADRERGVPMATDTLFRIASMTKAVTTVAAMTLVEDGTLLLSDPVSKYLPAFRQTWVSVPPPPGAPSGTPPRTAAAKRAITVRDLMTHTAGISYGGGPLEADYKAAGIHMWYCADRDETLGEWVGRLPALPFAAQPGEQFVYGFSTDVLGRVVEVASGQPLDEALRTRVLEPLGMSDTFFFVPPGKAHRLATAYAAREDGTIARAPERGRDGQGEYVTGPRKCFSGGAGLVSTIGDYARLLQMLLDGGTLDGVRLLSPASVASMTSNQVGSLYQDGALGFGLGFEVVEHVGRAGRLAAAGEFSWGSAYYPRYFVDPADGVVAVMMTQLLPAGGLDLHQRFRSLVYQAIAVPGR